VQFPEDYWPADKNRLFEGEAVETVEIGKSKNFPNNVCVEVLLTVLKGKPFPGKLKYQKAEVPVSAPAHGPDVSIRRAIATKLPHAVRCVDLTKTPSNGKKFILPQPNEIKQHQAPKTGQYRLRTRKPRAGAELLAFAALTMLSATQAEHGFSSAYHDRDPKNQRAARASPRAEMWKQSEEREIKKLWDMGTWEVTEIPEGVTLLPGTWSYKIKRDKDWNVTKLNARWNCRGDLQFPWEYNNTYSPTSRFAAIRQILAISVQEKLDLHHWDIAGAFCTSYVDKPIYLEAPTGYPLPEGKCLKLVKSQYGLRQASALFHDDLEKWMLAYGFTPVGPDGVIFRLA
jgi:hypothetical protein